MFKTIYTALGLAVVLGTVSASATAAYRHSSLNLFPAASVAAGGTIQVDGDLTDWKPEAFVHMVQTPELSGQYAVDVALAYDATGLLLAVRVTDSTPLQNRVDPAGQADKGWAGDALQMRIVVDPRAKVGMATDAFGPLPDLTRKVTHFTMWYSAPRQLASRHINYTWAFKDDVVSTGQDAGVVYQRGVGGYALETRIPWSRCRVEKPLAPGQSCMLTLQFLWGDAENKGFSGNFGDCLIGEGTEALLFNRPQNWGQGYFVKPEEVETKLREQAANEKKLWDQAVTTPAVAIPVAYDNPAAGFVSLALCAGDGQVVRTLLTKAKRDPGKQKEIWDGRNDDGVPVPAGKYTVKGLSHPGLTTRWLTSILNRPPPPWPTADDLGDGSADISAVIDAASTPDAQAFRLATWGRTDAQAEAAPAPTCWAGVCKRSVFDFYPGSACVLSGAVFRPTANATAKATAGKAPAIGWAKALPGVRQDPLPSLKGPKKEFYVLASDTVAAGLGKQGLYRFVENGALRWRYARVVIDFALKSMTGRVGDLNGAAHLAGPVALPEVNGGEIIACSTTWGVTGLLNEDGLFVDQIGADRRLAPAAAPAATATANLAVALLRQPGTGRVYLVNGAGDGRIWEVRGWENIRRLAPGTVDMTKDQYAKLVPPAPAAAPKPAAPATPAAAATPGKGQTATLGKPGASPAGSGAAAPAPPGEPFSLWYIVVLVLGIGLIAAGAILHATDPDKPK